MKLIKNLGMVIFLFFVISSVVFATGVNVYFNSGQTVKDHTNSTPLSSSSYVQWMTGNSSAPNPNNPGFVGSGTMFISFNVGEGTGVAGTFSMNNSDKTGATYLRIWEGGEPATGKYYTNVSANATDATNPMPADIGLNNIYCNYKADVPYTPNITKIEEIASTPYSNGTAGTKTSSLTIYSAQPTPTDGIREITGYQWVVAPAISGINLTAQTLTIPADKISTGETYSFSATHKNNFGATTSALVSYKVGSGGVGTPGSVIKYTYSLKKYDPAKLVVNDISSPVNTTAAALANAINVQAGSAIVSSVCKWDNGKTKAYVIGQAGSEDFAIQSGEGVQIYVTETKTVTLESQ